MGFLLDTPKPILDPVLLLMTLITVFGIDSIKRIGVYLRRLHRQNYSVG
jgi:hypothetical protein